MKRINQLLLALAFLAATAPASAQVQEAWVTTTVGDFFDDPQQPVLILDRDGNIIVGINTRVPDYESSNLNAQLSAFDISKYRPDGTLVFEKLESEHTEINKTLKGVAVDHAGNIYCAVRITRTVDPVNAVLASIFAVYKYDPDGNVVWKREYSDGQYTAPEAIAVDPAGNVYLTGFCKASGALVTDELPDYLTVKWNSAGTLQWARRYDGASPGEGFNVARAITVDGSENVYVTGQSQLNGVLGYATVKYDASGTQLWAARYNGESDANDNALAIARDVSGFIYVTGKSDGVSADEGSIATVKYNNDGAQIWVQREGSAGGEGRAIKVDGSGNVFVGGNTSASQMILLKLNFAGTKQWAFVKSGTGLDMNIDEYGNSYIAGTSSADGVLLKLNPAGTQQWIKNFDSPIHPGIVNPIAVSELANLYILDFSWMYCSGCGTPRYVANLVKYTQCDLICPGDITVNTTPGLCTGVVNYNVEVRGECGSNIAYSQPSGTALPVGTTIIAVADITTGETCSFNATVRDNERPQARCRNITVSLGATGSVTINAVQVDNGSSDNCGIQSLSLDKTSFNCSNVGPNDVVLTVRDVNGNTSSCTAVVTIQDNTPPVVKTQNITVYLNAAGTASISAEDIDDGSSDECGAVTLAINTSDFSCSDKGANTVILTVTDPNGNTASGTATVTVVDDIPPTITSVSADPGSLWPSDRKMKPVTISAEYFDNCPGTTWSVTDVAIKSGSFENDNVNPDFQITSPTTVNLRAEIPKKGSRREYTVIITATDAAGNTSTSSVDVAVSLNITTPASGAPFLVGTSVNLSGEFWDQPGAHHTAKWLIDDNTTVKATVTEPSGNQNGEVSGSYKFGSAGVYKLQMNVTDQDGNTKFANTSENLEAIVVIYDPKGGYTYGGGKFNSPAGALTSDPQATGEVSYGFTVNYYKGAKMPKGETQFDFKAGDFEYNALNFDYLAISDMKAQFRGTGRISGLQSGIAFIMTVIDGERDGTGIDKVRMKIFNKNTGEVYYDNQPGANDAEDPTMPVGENSTVVIAGKDAPRSKQMLTRNEVPAAGNLRVSAYPNPYQMDFRLNISSPVTGMAIIDFYTLSGIKVHQEERFISAGAVHTLRFAGLQRYGSLVYRVSIGGQVSTGMLISTGH